MNVAAALDDLEAVLTEEIRLERELAAAAGRRREALAALDASAVEHAGAFERAVLADLADAGERRLLRTSEAARAFALPAAETSVTGVAEAAGEPARSRLRSLAAELREAQRELARVNDVNRALTEQPLEHAKRAFGILGGARESGIYSRCGLPRRPELPRPGFNAVV